MNSTILSHNRLTPGDELYSMFYVRADNCDGENFDLVVIAEHERQAIEIWARHYYQDELLISESDFIAGRWADEGVGLMMLAAHGDLEQVGLEPGAAQWAVHPFEYVATETPS